MKQYFISLSALALVTVAANAQTTNSSADTTGNSAKTYTHHKSKDGIHGHHKGIMMKDINLTDAQKQQAKDINADYNKQITDLKNSTLSANDYKAKRQSIEKERKAKFESILTTEQKDKIAKAKKDRSEKMKVMSAKRMDKMKTDLNLTDEQVSKIKEQRESSISQAKAIKENASLTEDQKKEQLMNLRKTSKESVNSILTAEQLKKKEEIRNSRTNEWKNKKANKES